MAHIANTVGKAHATKCLRPHRNALAQRLIAIHAHRKRSVVELVILNLHAGCAFSRALNLRRGDNQARLCAHAEVLIQEVRALHAHHGTRAESDAAVGAEVDMPRMCRHPHLNIHKRRIHRHLAIEFITLHSPVLKNQVGGKIAQFRGNDADACASHHIRNPVPIVEHTHHACGGGKGVAPDRKPRRARHAVFLMQNGGCHKCRGSMPRWERVSLRGIGPQLTHSVLRSHHGHCHHGIRRESRHAKPRPTRPPLVASEFHRRNHRVWRKAGVVVDFRFKTTFQTEIRRWKTCLSLLHHHRRQQQRHACVVHIALPTVVGRLASVDSGIEYIDASHSISHRHRISHRGGSSRSCHSSAHREQNEIEYFPNHSHKNMQRPMPHFFERHWSFLCESLFKIQ